MSFTGVSMLGANPSPNPFVVDMVGYLKDKLQTQITHGDAPQSVTVYPYVTYLLDSALTEKSIRGGGGLKRDTYKFYAYSPNPLDAAVTADQLVRWLDNYRGLMGSTTVQTTTFDDQESAWEAPKDASGTGRHRWMTQFTFVYEFATYNSD